MKTEIESPAAVSSERAIDLLQEGHVELVAQVLPSSNLIFLTRVSDDELQALAIYKPHRGEQPLWDFPHGTLCLREVAAYAVSQALGWPPVPPTVLREGPHGIGALQLFIDADRESNYFSFQEDRRSDLLPVALFDLVANNADRKGGHLLLDRRDRIWAIDNALTFHVEPKLRTVIWDFAGQAIPNAYLDDLVRLQGELTVEGVLCQTLSRLLVGEEIAALRERLMGLLEARVFPQPDPDRRQVPWPLV
jgi:uncharacterized repeat protein (TIGR03843 family)